MKTVAILMNKELEQGDLEAKQHLMSECKKGGINLVDNISRDTLRIAEHVILVYNTYSGITLDFINSSKELIEFNIKPIILIINAQRKLNYQKICDEIVNVWRDYNPEIPYSSRSITFFYDNDKRIAYQIEEGNEKGIEKLINTLNVLIKKMKFFE